jgi:hypothetical protein
MEALSPAVIQIVIQTLGLPGLVFVIWHFDNKRLDKQQAYDRERHQQYREMYEKEQSKNRETYEREQQKLRESYDREHRADRDMVTRVLCQYKEDINAIASLYKNNVHLVGDYEKGMCRLEKLAEEMMSVVALNAQASSHLTDAIRNNTFCPQVRKELGKQ